MSVAINHSVATAIEQPIADADQATTTHQQTGNSANSVADHGGSGAGNASAPPTKSAREAVSERRAEINEMTEERLSEDPAYAKLQKKYEEWKDLETVFSAIEDHTVFAGDQKISLRDLEVLRDDPNADPGARAAANRLLNDKSIWNELATGLDGKNDNVVGVADVQRFLEKMTTGLADMKEKVRGEVQAEMAAERGVATGTQTQAGATASGSGATESGSGEAKPLFKAPTPSTKGGMEGAVENVNNTLAAVADATNDLAVQLMDPNLSAADRQKLQAKYNDLQQLQQMLTAMFTQLQQNISNLMKMYSDVAQNSIRNMK